MSIRSSFKSALLGSLLTLPSVVQAQAAADCWRPDEVEAARFEDFRLMMMVGALNCAERMPAVAQSYNAFMQRKKDVILANLYVVRAHFVRENGATEGATAFANYETLGGNRYSAVAHDRAKCETVDAYAKVAAAASDADLARLIGALSPGALPSGCKVTPRPVEAAAITAAITPVPVPALAAPAAVATPIPVAAPAPAPAVVAAAPASARPMTEAERVAASTAATRRLLAAVAAERAAPKPVPAVVPAAAPAAAPVAAAVPAVAPVAAASDAKVAPTSAPSPTAQQAQALAEAARALAAAAAAMQAPPAGN